jgi:murein DD-endopeptidase MepM/ murein hydrolase activator NlpD/GH24 family phage-related lysozyme (muramidase)
MTQGPKQQPEKSPSLRVAGVNTPQMPNIGQSPEAKQTIQLPDNTPQKTQEVIEANNAAFEAVARSNEAAAKSKIADLAAKGFGKGAQRFGAALESVADTLNIIQKREAKLDEKERQMKQEQIKEWRARKANVGRQKLHKELQHANQVTREEGLNQGIQYYRKNGEKVLDDFCSKVSPEACQEMTDQFHSELNSMEKDLTKRQKQQIEEQQDKLDQYQTAQLKLETAAPMAKLRHATSAEEAKKYIDTIFKKISKVAPSIEEDPTSHANVTIPILEGAADSTQYSVEAQAESAKALEAYKEYNNRVAPLYDKYNQGKISKDVLRAKTKEIAHDVGYPSIAGETFRTNEEKKRDALQIMQTDKKIRNLQQSDESSLTNEQLKQASKYQKDRLLFDYINGDYATREEFEKAISNGHKRYKAIPGLAQEFEQDSSRYRTLQQGVFKLDAEIADTGMETRQFVTNDAGDKIIAKPQFDETSQRIILPKVSEQVQEAVEQGKLTPAQAEKVKRALKNQQNAKLREMAILEEKWRDKNINIRDPSDDSMLVEQQAEVQPIIDQAKTSPVSEDQRNMSGTNKPNPKKGVAYKPDTPKATSLAKKNGVTMPFKKEDSPQIKVTSEYGMRDNPRSGNLPSLDEGGEIHNGVDIGAPKGTKVHAVQGGEIIGSRHIKGFGQTVLVKTPDGHTEQYSHLKSRNVAEGDNINPGESIGKVGTTGNATGPVLHMQVWQGDPSWGTAQHKHEQTMDPMKYLNQTTHSRAEPRGKGPPQNQQPKKPARGRFEKLQNLNSTPPLPGEGHPKPLSERRASDGLAEHVANAEGFRSQAYRDLGDNTPIIGFGFKRAGGNRVKMGDTMSKDEAVKKLAKELNTRGSRMEKYLPDNIKLTQGQYDALIDLVYTVGESVLKDTTLSKKLNQFAQDSGGKLTKQQQQEIANEIRKWNKDGDGKVLDGLRKRREANAQMFVNNRYEANPMEAYE